FSRSIVKPVLSREQSEGVGVRVRRSIGRPELCNHDPFLMLDKLSVDKNGGFPDHPHRNLEPWPTCSRPNAAQGSHRDISGRSAMHDCGYGGSCIRRCRPSLRPVLWIVAQDKFAQEHRMCEPQYQELQDPQIPRARYKGEVVVKVIASELQSFKSQIYTRTPIVYLDFKTSSN
ncbi:hypothetical protein K457DRAFT_902256, partial [Linnemannia elongata AG-77]